MIQTGTILQQRYKIDKQIGQGGMGAVYVAMDSRFGSTVAIKETLCMDDNFRKAIEREARLLNSLKHNALPRVSDHFEEDNSMFLVMEYIPGEDLCCVLDERGKPFQVDEMLKWGDQLLDALDFLHNQEMPVIHRDIKPQNLKLTPQGQVVLLDFGLAKGNPSEAGHQTAAKSIFGYSRNYASLEQIQGTGTDPRSDLYSLSATLYHLMTQVAPEDALTRAMSVLAQKPDPLLPASQVNPDIPRGVAGVLQCALALNASDRPSSAKEMRQMLRESENFAYLADPNAFAQAPTQAHVFAQPTRLMSDATHAEQGHSTEARTEVFTGNTSQATAVRIGDTSVVPRRSSLFAVAAGAFFVIFVGAAIAGGIYVVKPSVFGIGQTQEPAAIVPSNPPEANAAPASNVNSDPLKAETHPMNLTNSAATSSAESSKQAESTDRWTETTRNNKPVTPEKPMTKVDLGDGTSVQLDDLEDPTHVVITKREPNGKITTMRVTPEMDPELRGGQRPRPANPFPPDFDPNKLTPEQRRKFQNMVRRQMQHRPPMPQPVPQESP